MIDTLLVQKIIDEEISPEFEIYKYFDTEPYIIIFWKHKKYDIDDERGQTIGAGPVIFDKQTNEYRLLGSGEWFYGDFSELLKVTEEEENRRNDHSYLMGLLEGNQDDDNYTKSLIEKFKSNIIRREYVNSEDIDYLCILTGARRINESFETKFLPEFEYSSHWIVVFNNEIAQNKLTEIWDEIDFKYEILSETELLLWKIKPTHNNGLTQ